MFGLNPKDIISQQLSVQFQKAGLVQVKFIFDGVTQITTAQGLTKEGKEEPLPVEQKENNMIKNILVKQIKKGLDFEFTKLIANINVEKKSINMYALNLEGKLIPIQL